MASPERQVISKWAALEAAEIKSRVRFETVAVWFFMYPALRR